jgi:hypothetical protein
MIHTRKETPPAHVVLFALLLGSTLLGGCAGSQMTNTWKDPSYTGGPVTNVLAIAVRQDPVRRRIWEDDFVRDIQAHGVSATPSYSIFPAMAPDTLQVIDAVRSGGYDAVATSVRLPNVTEETYVAGYSKREPVIVFSPFLHAYATYWQDVQVPGYTETNEKRRFQTNVWTTREGGRLIWSGTLETIDATTGETVLEVIHNRIVPEMVGAGIIPPKSK